MKKILKLILPFFLFFSIISNTTFATVSHEGKDSKENSYSARKFISNATPDAIKDFALTTRNILGNNLGQAGVLDDLVKSSTDLGKKFKFTTTTTRRLEDVNRHAPVNMLATAIKYGKKHLILKVQ